MYTNYSKLQCYSVRYASKPNMLIAAKSVPTKQARLLYITLEAIFV